MKIDHVAMYVNDLETMKDFFIRFFGATAGGMYHNPRTRLKTYFLTFEDHTRLEIMSRPDMLCLEKALQQTGYTHLSFSVGGKEKVDELTRILKNSGCKMVSRPRTTGDGYYESCILDPENNQIEITE